MTLALLLLLALTASWTRPVQSEDKDETVSILEDLTFAENPKAVEVEEDPENHDDVAGSGDGRTQASTELGSARSDSGAVEDIEPTAGAEQTETEDQNTVIMIIILLVLTLVIISVIVCGVIIYRRRTTKDSVTKDNPYLDNEDHENVPMPMFEDDIPSVMELEMEDLENWMAKDGGTNVDTGQI
ncbi:transmembrane protein 154-like [Myxocyprinus asiaticus]|uniref:transmembrane protein 154-like n=1 Tax=Myxocyprinus asiaticus TaxID=70543 RepID=UPI0022214DA5|nr:transmembrane protein 154-like [Myxocyprinus asiaticus]XP_051558560.1 transmembrane protein 154-like [Myxocyprinus asiaticus]XP_051558561.1 transmembrane protein 154-like [Myxocyprinus asiaticus]